MTEIVDWNKRDMLDLISALKKDIPIEWDRIIDTGNYKIVFGWIPNVKQDDFVAICFLEYYALYFTSSAKYTKKMARNWDYEGHSNCIKFNEYFKKQLEESKTD